MTDREKLVNYYINLLILQYNTAPLVRGTIKKLVEQVLGSLISKEIEDGFNIETSVGKQLDILGKYLNIERYQLGYRNITDDEMRILIKLMIIKNNSFSSTKDIVDALWSLFGNDIKITDNKDMTFTYELSENINELMQKLLIDNDWLPRPMGVGYKNSAVVTKSLLLKCDLEGVSFYVNGVLVPSGYKEMEQDSAYSWSIVKEGYKTITGYGTLINDTIISVSALTLNVNVQEYTATINGEQYQKGIFFLTDETLDYTYQVEAEGYISKSGFGSTSISKVIDVELVQLPYVKVNVAIPDCTIFINGENQDYVQLNPNDEYSWSVQHLGYQTISGSGTITEQPAIINVSNAYLDFNVVPDSYTFDGLQVNGKFFISEFGLNYSYTATKSGYKSINATGIIQPTNEAVSNLISVNMETVYYEGQVIFESATAGTHNVNLLTNGIYEITCVGAGGGGAGRIFDHYYSNSIYFWNAVASGGTGGLLKAEYRLNEQNISVVIGKGGDGASSRVYDTSSSFPSSKVNGWARGGNGSETKVGDFITCNGGTGGYASITGYNSVSMIPNFSCDKGIGGNTDYSTINLIRLIDNKKYDGGTNTGYQNGKTTAFTISVTGGALGLQTGIGNGFGDGGFASVTGRTNNVGWDCRGGSAGYVKIVYKGVAN